MLLGQKHNILHWTEHISEMLTYLMLVNIRVAEDLGLIMDKTVKLEWHKLSNTRTRCLRITQASPPKLLLQPPASLLSLCSHLIPKVC